MRIANLDRERRPSHVSDARPIETIGHAKGRAGLERGEARTTAIRPAAYASGPSAEERQIVNIADVQECGADRNPNWRGSAGIVGIERGSRCRNRKVVQRVAPGVGQDRR